VSQGRSDTPQCRTSMSVEAWKRQIDFHNLHHDKLNQGVVPSWIAVQLVEELREARAARSETVTTKPPRIEKALGLAHFLKGYGEPGGANDPEVLKAALGIIAALRGEDK
jgi:hypothetical protein